MKLNRETLLATYISIPFVMREIVNGLMEEQVKIIPEPTDTQRAETLKWLHENPYVLRAQSERISTPIFSSYEENDSSIIIRSQKSAFMADLFSVVKVAKAEKIYTDYWYANLLLAHWLLEGRKNLSLSLSEFRQYLGLSKDTYSSFSHIKKILDRSQGKCRESGLTLTFQRRPERYTRHVLIEIEEEA